MQANVDHYDLETYYREEIILGSGAFVEIANDYDDFARAFLRKLRRELTPLVSQDNGEPRALIQKPMPVSRTSVVGRAWTWR